MGYYCDWDVDVRGSGPIYNKLMAQKDEEYVSESYEITLGRWLECEQNLKWYEVEEEGKAFSRKWPNVMLIVTYLGEDGAQGRHWFRNGHTYHVKAQVAYPEPDFDKVMPLNMQLELESIETRKREVLEKMKELQAELDEYQED
ncbi:hypothetical protein AXJ18_gp173 [Streptomyces phage Jay2Jay]|uniref:Uncharacterized protein n=2 Tax=Samistivirus jay2jay TaxID=2560786 RepID=A0A221SAZ6_9CAUD|nr:hypothetical protein AXJ18_gp173 [Streptomyces phage Jay2Jay]AIW02601.1 hypothetical protein PBI_JAY2JAY_106 [Streptomyces phage Jay2Jay]ASN73176.1 hypothetical protein SEA_WARPY_105 [Streptomyces phage Warpy]